mmetsp:Transcript_30223/g.85385  ORF Transcript_30223/g.85385 Transcript_30223/m.85385 type:complete len:200 (+) Transcript_30223:1145-1744(+)
MPAMGPHGAHTGLCRPFPPEPEASSKHGGAAAAAAALPPRGATLCWAGRAASSNVLPAPTVAAAPRASAVPQWLRGPGGRGDAQKPGSSVAEVERSHWVASVPLVATSWLLASNRATEGGLPKPPQGRLTAPAPPRPAFSSARDPIPSPAACSPSALSHLPPARFAAGREEDAIAAASMTPLECSRRDPAGGRLGVGST